MHYLYEHQLGYHSLALGYPSIDGCNAICLQTKTGLFGVHVYGCNAFNHIGQAMEKECAAFESFVTNHPQGKDFMHLYCVCFHARRGWAKGKTWKDEMKVYAKKLGYSGQVSSFDLSSVPDWPNGSGTSPDSAYVEFRRVFDKVEILYKPWHQCVHPPEIKASSIGPSIDYRSTNNKGQVSDTFWFNKAITSLATNGSGFVISPDSIRLSFKQK